MSLCRTQAERPTPAGSPVRSRRWSQRRRLAGIGVLTATALFATGCSISGSASTSSSTPNSSSSSHGVTGSGSAAGSASGSPASPGAASAAAGAHGVGAPVVHPSCTRPPTTWKNFKAPDAVVPDLPELEAGTNHSKTADKWTYSASQVHQWMAKPQTAPKGKKLVFITFDDGPDSTVTPKELSNLEKAGVPATFFMITPQLQGVPVDLLRRSLRDGNGLDIHSYSHDYKYLFHGDANQRAAHVTCDYDWALAQARAVIGSDYDPSGFRYPGGEMSWNDLSKANAGLAKRGVVPIDWNAMSGDADAHMPTTIPGYVTMVKQSIAESGNPRVVVILNHDIKEKTAEAMPSILAWLKSQGYQFGIIS